MVYMSTETCVKCGTFRLYHASYTYLDFFISANYVQKWIFNLYSFILKQQDQELDQEIDGWMK